MHPNLFPSAVQAAIEAFEGAFGGAAHQILRAPARLNILGEHVDYVTYLPTASLPFGSHEHQMWMIFRANDESVIRGISLHSDFPAFHFEVLSETVPRDQTWSDALYARPVPAPDWSNYVKGAVLFAQHKFQLSQTRGFDFVVASTIPPQGGASSSSALGVLAGAAFREIHEVAYTPFELAEDGAQAEWYVGTRGGAMDQMAICLAQRYQAVHLTYADHHAKLLPLPGDGFRWVTFFSHPADKGREVMLAYNERVFVSRLMIPALLAQQAPEFRALAFAHDWSAVESRLRSLPESLTLAQVQAQWPDVYEQCQRMFPMLVRDRFTSLLKVRDRALHHLGEARRVREAVHLLGNSTDEDHVMKNLGASLDQSHTSLCNLYEVGTPLVDELIRVIRAEPNVYGARLMGGGFGGNVLALLRSEHVEKLIERVQREFYARQHRNGVATGAIMISTPGTGLRAISML